MKSIRIACLSLLVSCRAWTSTPPPSVSPSVALGIEPPVVELSEVFIEAPAPLACLSEAAMETVYPIRPIHVFIEASTGYGQGSIIASRQEQHTTQLLVLTAAHVVARATRIRVKFDAYGGYGQEFSAERYHAHLGKEPLDVALITGSVSHETAQRILPCTWIHIGDQRVDTPHAMDTVWMTNHPVAHSYTLGRPIDVEFDKQMHRGTYPIQHLLVQGGFSGSPVLTRKNGLLVTIGVISGVTPALSRSIMSPVTPAVARIIRDFERKNGD